LSFLAIFVIMFIFFRRIELALLAMIPIVCTGLITAGIMALLGIELNVFSTIVTTLILGLGIDFSIFMTSGLQLRFTTGKNELSIYRTSILLAVLTTLLALGALIFAKHPALTSISWASIIGVLSALFMTFVLYPRLFYWLIERPQQNGKAPTSLRELINALFSFTFYGIGGVFYSLFGIAYMKLMPIALEKKKKWYRSVIAKFIKSIMYTNPWVKKKVLNLYNEKFEKPAIIIANHTSFLDTLSMGFVPAPIIFVVNDWVYNSPIFGKAVQLAGYVPASDGMENSESKLIDYVKQGYSLVIFPEGTRSVNKVIGRFHKGAFYLAKKYNIDIIPVFLHGNGDINPKGTFVIRDGSQTVVIGKRISAQEFVDKETKVITKEISTLYKADYRMLRHQLEDENYFQKRVMKSFMYKTNEVVSAAKKEFAKNKNWLHAFNLHIPHDAKIQRFANDYGVIDVMLCLQEPSRKVNIDIFDKENRCIAKQNHLLQNHKIIYSKKHLQDLDVLIVNTKFAQSQWESFNSVDSLQYLIIDNEIRQSLNLDGFEPIKEIDGMCLYKRNGHGKEI
jgi:1-acyl-sn-glycerol-3-phosphate acyltransferase